MTNQAVSVMNHVKSMIINQLSTKYHGHMNHTIWHSMKRLLQMMKQYQGNLSTMGNFMKPIMMNMKTYQILQK